MKAINLIPADARRRGPGSPSATRLPVYVLLGLLGAALALVTFYVLASNSISSRKAKLATLQSEVAAAQAEASQLGSYVTFAQMAQARTATVRQIAAGRFDWHAAMLDLAKVVPGNTSLQSLVATASPSSSGVGGAGASVLRSDISSPAFELTGCTATQDDVARLMSRLRLMSGVTRVTLGSAVKTEGPQPGASISTTTPASASGTSQNQGCGPNTPAFDLVVFFQLPAASLPSTGGVK